MSCQLISPPISILLSFYFAVYQLVSLSLSLWRSLASHSPWVSFPLPSTTSMATTTSHRDRGTSFVAKLRKNDLLHCKMNISLILCCEFFYLVIFIFIFFLLFFFFFGGGQGVQIYNLGGQNKKKLKIHYIIFFFLLMSPYHQCNAAPGDIGWYQLRDQTWTLAIACRWCLQPSQYNFFFPFSSLACMYKSCFFPHTINL